MSDNIIDLGQSPLPIFDPTALALLREVLALHHPTRTGSMTSDFCEECSKRAGNTQVTVQYPCPTVKPLLDAGITPIGTLPGR